MLAAIGLHLGIHWAILKPRFVNRLHLANVSTAGIIVRLVVLGIVLGAIYFILPTGTRRI